MHLLSEMANWRGSVSLLLLGCVYGACTSDGGGSSIGVYRASLRQARDCADLESMLRDDARKKMNAQIDALVDAAVRYGQGGWTTPPAFGAPSGAGSFDGTREDSASGRATDYSETNTQVDGVDEADVVKNDGKYVYLLHGDRFLVLDAWPASALSSAGSFAIEGQPTEMYVAGGYAVVYSVVDGTSVYEAAGIEPRPPYYDAVRYDLAVDASGFAPYPWYFSTPLGKITVLTLNGAEVALAREMYVEGSYLSSRRVGQHVRTVMAGGAHGPALAFSPPPPYPTTPEGWRAAYENLRAENEAKIAAAGHEDWVPVMFSRSGSEVTAFRGGCETFYVPTAGSTEYGMTSVVALDVGSSDAPKSATIMGAVDTVYSTSDTLYLAARAWADPGVAVMGFASGGGGTRDGGAASDGGAVAPVDAGTKPSPSSPVPATPPAELGRVTQRQETLVTLNRTHLHKFVFTLPDEPAYVASGTVAGSIKDQFSIDEHEGRLRVATTEDRTTASPDEWRQTRSNNLFVLEASGDELVTVGSLTDLAPGELIYSSRFMGTRAYLVTFRQVDPLFVISLDDPLKPTVLGELEIPGFSEYMHPVDASHLVTIGRDQGVAVQLFDVTDPTAPRLADKFVFAVDGYTEASQSHKAFTYFASRSLLAFPYVGYSSDGTGMRSSLELFRVGTTTGIEHLGSIDHTAFFAEAPQGFCGGYYGAQVRRGLFMEDFVYTTSYGGVTAHAMSDLTTPVASVPLPPPDTGFEPCMGL